MKLEEAVLLKRRAMEIRIAGLKMVQNAQSGHLGGAFSLAEIMSVLYFDKMNIDPKKPHWEDRDRLVLSKGHATVALYPALAIKGYFSKDELRFFRKLEGNLSGHAEMNHVPGVDMSTGSLGQGLSVAVGMALGGKLSHKDFVCYAILGDGEIEEGQIWEACMAASKYNLDNLISILDSNKVQLDGTVKEIMDTGDIEKKFEAFGFFVQRINGHDIGAIADAIDKAKARSGCPSIIIADTVKGKDVSFMEGKAEWHGRVPDEEEFQEALKELETKLTELEKEV